MVVRCHKTASAATFATVPIPSPLGVVDPKVDHTPVSPSASASASGFRTGTGSKVKSDDVALVSCVDSSGTEAEARSSYPFQVLSRAYSRDLLNSAMTWLLSHQESPFCSFRPLVYVATR